MKKYAYNCPVDGTVILTENEILDEYWEYFCAQMKRVGKEREISKENCIDSWVVLHWAWEVA